MLITGAGARIGAALAKGLAADGWPVAIHYRRSETKAKALAAEINEAGGKAICVQANLSIFNEVNTLVARAAEALGQPITVLINNASTFTDDRADTSTRATMDHHLEVNLRAPLQLAQDLALQLPEGASGSIINMIDQRVLKPNPLFFTYGISKSALYWSTKTLAQSLAPKIRVNGIGPGPTLRNTGQTEDEFASESRTTLLGRGSPPDTILQAARYLLVAESVTGQMLAVDGGQHLTWQTPDLLFGGDDGP
ncbi:SDR family oxidoreductase [Litorimonas sp. RW-G-Af-16]|uniref:SDR family oxidoreductase n=1 Tax=Litorimonas sp. RW-G-Af-16 TaxID=3241168 RepID=UPI00390CC318